MKSLTFRSLLFCLLSSFILSAAATEADPRPTLLFLGGKNTAPFRGDPAWTDLIAGEHPEWRVVVQADNAYTLDELNTHVNAWLNPLGRVDVVIVVGTNSEVALKAWEEKDAAVRAKQLSELFDTVKAHPVSESARLVFVTPVPVIEARFDQWTPQAYGETGAEARSKAHADALAQAAEAAGAIVLDAHTWQMEDVQDGKAGRILGSNGQMLRGWAHPIFARWIDPLLVEKVNPVSGDPEGWAAWKQEREAMTRLRGLLAESAGGTVRTGAPLKALDDGHTFTVPAERLTGSTLALLVKAEPGNVGSFRPGTEDRNKGAALMVGDTRLPTTGSGLAVIDESDPQTPVDKNRFSVNIGRLHYRPGLREEEGKRLWTLLRFDLANLEPGVDGRLELPSAEVEQLQGTYGRLRVFPVLSPDNAWTTSATWVSPDGVASWTGGDVDAEKRRQDLRAFLDTDPPPGASALATAILEETQ